jgi:two-component system chemotaxis response regulator CheY
LTYVDRQVTFAISPLIRGISLARKILLADDSVTAQNMGRKILADAGYEVIAVNNGSAALKKIGELKPDLVILDVYMPGYSGLEVCQRLKESPETARIPVLLTVGKLEPFKPEEAQRVRAEGFIVKPFEASELLGTLSKMEDKVVPRAEPSKPGRFARAIAAAEESSRGGRDGANTDNGWKNRIGFPKDKDKAEEEKIADESAASAEKTWKKKQEAGQPAAGAAEANVDLAALAPAGLPKDVTPEEVAAIAAAAAQMQMVVSALKGESQASATQLTEANPKAQIAETIVERASQSSSVPASQRAEVNLPSSPEVPGAVVSAVEMEAKTEALAESKNEEAKRDSVSGEAPAAETYRRRKGDARAEETQDVPVTMAATAESVVAASLGGSRWTAVSVALEGSEAAISLDHEMQKAHAAFAAADSAGSSRVPEAAPVSAGNFSAPAPAESPAAISSAEPAKAPEPESSQQPDAAAPAPIKAETTPPEALAQTSPTAAFAESNQKPAPVAEPAAQEFTPRPESESEATGGPSSAVASVSREENAAEKPAAEPAPEPRLDSETVKNTAAAWATWRQVHDRSQSNQVAEAQPREIDQLESAPPETAARAVAAGAEQISQEAVAAAAADGDQSNVASIVDSVLADLRPKLMEEINRKMSKKK